jgi:hypothetical protein
MILLEEGFLDRYGLGEKCPDDRCPHYVSRRLTQSREIEMIGVTSSKAAIIVFQSSAGEILETGYDLCNS